MAIVISMLGIKNASELLDCDVEEFQKMGDMMKKIPRRMFARAINEAVGIQISIS
jgi:hypothetical protein